MELVSVFHTEVRVGTAPDGSSSGKLRQSFHSRGSAPFPVEHSTRPPESASPSHPLAESAAITLFGGHHRGDCRVGPAWLDSAVTGHSMQHARSRLSPGNDTLALQELLGSEAKCVYT